MDRLNKKLKQISFFIILICVLYNLIGQTRIMTYNVENYGGDILPNSSTQYQDEEYREDDFRLIINKIDPDILGIEEVFGQYSGAERFLNRVMNHNKSEYKMVFVDQTQDNGPEDIWQDIAVFYKKKKFRMLSRKEVDITPNDSYVRNAIKVELENIAHRDTLILFVAHLKAGLDNDDKKKRKYETQKLRDYCNNLSKDQPFVICGDLNFYSSNEDGWQNLTGIQSGNKGRVYDPIDRIGKWHNNRKYEDILTQSTRLNQGGLDDRFDFILISDKVKREKGFSYIENSYTTFGNDGMHFNQSINWNENQEVSEKIANSIYNSSDHLPVFADFKFDSSNVNKVRLFQNYPNPFQSESKIKFYLKDKSHIEVTIFNLKGQIVKTIADTTFESGNSIVKWDATDKRGRRVSSGVYLYRLKVNNKNIKTKKMVLLK